MIFLFILAISGRYTKVN